MKKWPNLWDSQMKSQKIFFDQIFISVPKENILKDTLLTEDAFSFVRFSPVRVWENSMECQNTRM